MDTTPLADPTEGIVLSLERLIHFAVGFTQAEFDSTVVAWKEKVCYDLIRPTSAIKSRGDEQITTWAPGGVQTFAAKYFEAYVRVMRHSEYVSGSSCIFQGLQDYIREYLNGIGVDPVMPVAFPPTPPGSCKVEPGTIPSTTIQLQYPSVEAMAFAGGQSRINGGVHFADSVPAGEELCDGIGDVAAAGILALI